MPPGRPKKELDWDQIDKLCQIQCTIPEIAAFFECSDDTLDNHCKSLFGMKFSEYFAQKRQGGRMSLRRAQWQKAVHEKSNTMLIWLGKQYLDQSDKNEVNLPNAEIKLVYGNE